MKQVCDTGSDIIRMCINSAGSYSRKCLNGVDLELELYATPRLGCVHLPDFFIPSAFFSPLYYTLLLLSNFAFHL